MRLYKIFFRITFFLLLPFIFSLCFFPKGIPAQEEETLIANYPLHLIRYIYGKNSEGRDDTQEKGGTPVSCKLNTEGSLYVLFTGNRSEIQVFDKKGGYKFRFGEKGNKEGQFSSNVCGLAINSKNEVYVADVLKQKILVFDKSGKFIRAFSSLQGLHSNDPKQDTYPAHIAMDHKNHLYISDGRNGHVWIYDPEGQFAGYLGGPGPGLFPSAGHICFDSKEQIYVLEGLANGIRVCSPQGTPITFIGESGNRAGQFLRISGIAIDSKDHIYATDIVQCVIQIFDPQGKLLGVVKEIIDQDQTQRLKAPSGIFIDNNDYIYVIEQPLHRIMILTDSKDIPKGNKAHSLIKRRD